MEILIARKGKKCFAFIIQISGILTIQTNNIIITGAYKGNLKPKENKVESEKMEKFYCQAKLFFYAATKYRLSKIPTKQKQKLRK